MTRALYRRADLHRLLSPRSIAIVGASDKPGAFSSRTFANLSRFEGQVNLVNARYGRINDRPCYPSLRALPEVPDCVIVAVPREAVLGVVREAGDIGAGGAIIYASGFAETGIGDRVAQQQALAEVAAASGLRILGPNCIGAVNNHLRAGLTFQVGYTEMAPPAGNVGLVSQSGALGYALLEGAWHGQGYSHVLAAGNSCDVDVLDLAAYLLDEPECRSVACLLEGIADFDRTRELADLSEATGKPVIIYKTAVSESSAQVAKSHTGSLAGTHDAFVVAMRECNFVLVESMAELAEASAFFAKASAPKSDGVAVMATSGGAAVISADSAARYGVSLPQPGDATQTILDANIPEFGSARNPCDLTAQVLNSPESFVGCVRAMLDDPKYGALILPQVTADPGLAVKRCEAITRLATTSDKPICVVWLSEWLEGPGPKCYTRDDRVAFFRSMDRCFKTIGLWHQWSGAVSKRATHGAAPEVAPAIGIEARQWLRSQPEIVTEYAAKKLIAMYGLPVVREIRAESRAAAVAAAREIGFPVALKLDSPDAAHKTELGLVRLSLADADEVARACEGMEDRSRSMRSGTFLVQSMAQGTLEMMLGMKRDPVFGPLVMIGIGGVLVEIFGDVAVALAPVRAEEARRMLSTLKGFRMLQGYRGHPGVDIDSLIDLVVKFSSMCADLGHELDEIDINPVIAGAQGLVVVDALLVRRKGASMPSAANGK